jgi:iron complex outermembrane receptor protein
MTTQLKRALLLGCGFALVGVATQAQTRSPPETTQSVSELVVTANKRVERAQQLAGVATVVTPQVLTQLNINNVADLSKAVPSLSAPAQNELEIWGVGTQTFARSAEASVGVVLDGVSLANAAPVPQLFDVARVEVLPGPQGTVFGAYSSAGVVNVTTNAPDPTKFGASAAADFGSRVYSDLQGFLNIPLAGNAAFRIAGSFVRQPETIKNLPDGSWDDNNTASVRARFLWEPSDRVTINLIGDYNRQSIVGGALWAVYQSTPDSELTQQLALCGIVPSRSNNYACQNNDQLEVVHYWGGAAQVDYAIGGATLTSLTGFREYDSDQLNGDSDSTLLNILNLNTGSSRIDNVSEELRLTSPASGLVEYIAGLYYFHSGQSYAGAQAGGLGFLPPPFTLGQNFNTSADLSTYAAFGQATIHATHRLRFIVGGRLNRDELTASTMRFVHPGSIGPFGPLNPVTGSDNVSDFSYRLGAQYDVTSNAMAYLTFNRGYKGPAINDQSVTPAAPLVVKPEIPNAWQLGLKTNLLDRRLAIDVALFHSTIKDFQTQVFSPGLSAFVFSNAPQLTTQGVTVDVFGHLTQNLSFNGGLIYDDAKYGPGYLVACSQGQTAAEGCDLAGGTVQDANGTPLAGAPKFKVTAASEYHHHLSGDLEGYLSADVVYTSRIYYGQGYDPDNSTGSHVVVGARLGIRTGRWDASIFARNLFDERVPSFTIATPLAPLLGDPKSYSQIFGPESFRVVGAALKAHF